MEAEVGQLIGRPLALALRLRLDDFGLGKSIYA